MLIIGYTEGELRYQAFIHALHEVGREINCLYDHGTWNLVGEGRDVPVTCRIKKMKCAPRRGQANCCQSSEQSAIYYFPMRWACENGRKRGNREGGRSKGDEGNERREGAP